jgi:pimeloyl-ACP methyl ester carboxylesterase
MPAKPVRAMYFAGFGNAPVPHSALIRQTLDIPTDRFHVLPYWSDDYREGFVPQRILARARKWAATYSSDQLLLIGSSMGGHLATQLAIELRAQGRNVVLVLLSPVASAQDISPAYRALRYAPASIMTNVMKLASINWLRGVPATDRPRVREYYAACDAIPWRIKQQQLKYIARATAPTPGSLAEIPTYVIYLKGDPVVSLTSLPHYEAAGRNVTATVFEASGHIDLVEYPQVWAKRLAPVARWLQSL